ncbi:MAG: fructose-1,6-bisphosphate aldolase/phosphatase [Methermicoccaceae archaeon]
MRTTFSIIKADVGSFAGHHVVPKELEMAADSVLAEAKGEVICDYHITHCGDDLELVMTHDRGEKNEQVHGLAWDAFQEAAKVSGELGLYAVGQDLLSDVFAGNVSGLGPASAEMEFEERRSNPVLTFMMDKTEPGAFNLPIYKMFADPFNTAGLVIDPTMHSGFVFEVWDIKENKKVNFACPEELYDMLALIGSKARYVIKRVYPKEDNPKAPSSDAVAVVSTEKLAYIAGEYVGKDDPVSIVRVQSGLPATGEALEPFSHPMLVSGWMRGSFNGPLLPTPVEHSTPTRFDGPPRVIGLGFQVKDGVLRGPVDLFDDPAFDRVRAQACELADYMRAHGPFEPHRLSDKDMEYTTLPDVLKRLEGRFEDLE